MWIDENNIDWKQLREQKRALLEVRKSLCRLPVNVTETDERHIDALSSIVHLLDYIQDTAVDTGCKAEEEVFGDLR